MKTLHLAIVITIAVTASVIIIALMVSSYPQNQVPVYQYVIHEPYQGVDKSYGTVIIQNQTFHVANLDKMFDNKSRPEWIQMYDVNFSFPNGIRMQNTPGGGIMESYITFPDDPVPYRIAIGLGSSPSTPIYDYTTVLSTHKEPQAGFTLHNDTVQLVVNWSKIHSDVNIMGLNDTYRLGQPIDFQVHVHGYDYFNAGGTPDINITKSDGTVIWQNKRYVVLCCVPELMDYDRAFNFTNLGGPIEINKTGLYNLVVTYNDQKIQKQFNVISSTINFISSIREEQVGKDIVLQKPSGMEKPFPICNSNPAKEKLIREKQQILVDALLAEEEKYGGFKNRIQHLPWSGIGYDCVDNALEVYILPEYFNAESFPKYFEKIRSIVGNSIDIVLSPEGYAIPV